MLALQVDVHAPQGHLHARAHVRALQEAKRHALAKRRGEEAGHAELLTWVWRDCERKCICVCEREREREREQEYVCVTRRMRGRAQRACKRACMKAHDWCTTETDELVAGYFSHPR